MAANLCAWIERRVAPAGVGIVLCLAMVGCGSGQAPTVPVEGTVLYQGKPLTSGSVMFLSATGSVAVGEIGKDGTFRLSTDKAEGATIGTHRVAINSFREPTAEERAKAAGTESGPQPVPAIPQKYLTPDTSNLTAEVKAKNEPFRFELTD